MFEQWSKSEGRAVRVARTRSRHRRRRRCQHCTCCAPRSRVCCSSAGGDVEARMERPSNRHPVRSRSRTCHLLYHLRVPMHQQVGHEVNPDTHTRGLPSPVGPLQSSSQGSVEILQLRYSFEWIHRSNQYFHRRAVPPPCYIRSRIEEI